MTLTESHEQTEGEDIWPADSLAPRLVRIRAKVAKPEAIATFLVVSACVVFVFREMQPSQLLKNTTPNGGDLGAHEPEIHAQLSAVVDPVIQHD